MLDAVLGRATRARSHCRRRRPGPRLPAMAQRPVILVVGGGYVGLYTALRLQRKLSRGRAEIIVVDPQPHMTYQPFLPEAAAGSVEPRHVVVPLRTTLRHCRVITGRGHRAHPRREAGPDRAGRGRAVRGVLRRAGDGRRARWRGRCPSPGWPSTASASRTSARPSTCATTCSPGSTRPARPTTPRCGSGRSPSRSSAAATPGWRRSPSSRTWPATPSSTTTRGCRRPTCAGCWSRRRAGSCPRSTWTWPPGRSSS